MMRIRTKVGSRRALLIVASTVATILSAGVTFAVRRHQAVPVHQEPTRQLAAQGTNAPEVALAPGDVSEDRWSLGVQRTYELDFGANSQVGTESSESVFGTGKLRLVAQQANEQGATLQGVFSDLSLLNPEIERAEEARAIEERMLSAELARPFLVFVTNAGSVEAISVDPTIGDRSFSFIRGFVASLQFIEPADPNPSWKAWTAQETDNFGICAARYQRVAPGRFKKTKADYGFLEMTDKLVGPDGTIEKEPPRIVSEAMVEFQGGVVRSVATQESVSVTIGEQTVQSQSHLALKLADTRRVQLTVLNPSGWKREPLYRTRDQSREGQLAARRRKLGNASFPDLLSALTAVPKTAAATRQRWDVVDRLAALFQLHPESLGDALRALRSALGREEGELLLAALANSKTTAAQAALAEVAEDGALQRGLRQGAVMRLALQENPTDQTLHTLGKLANGRDVDLHDGALLALGAAARSAARVAATSDTARQVVREIEHRARGTDDVAERTLLLSALGNTGSSDAFATVERALTDRDPMVRSAAVNALRLIPGGEVDELIASTITRDPDPRVRRSAVDTAHSRAIEGKLLAALTTSLQQDPDALVRIGVVNVFTHQVANSVVRSLLLWTAANDAAPEVRRAADRALEPESAASKR